MPTTPGRMYDALTAFTEHMHRSADALEELVDVLRGDELDPEARRASQDTVMEFGFLPATNTSGGSGGGDDFMYTEGSRILTEGDSIPIEMEGS